MATWNLSETKHHVLICNGGSCKKVGAEDVTQSLRKEISDRGLDPVIHTSRTLCNGRCQDKCVLITYPDGRWYKNISSEDAPQIVESLVLGQAFEEKLSHCFHGEKLERTEGTVIGKIKEEEAVKKVSKKW